jgi:VWFA-related protein
MTRLKNSLRQPAWLAIALIFAGESCISAPSMLAQSASTPAGTSQTASSQPAAQPNTATTTVHVDVKVVTMQVTVRDKHGAIVPNLTKDEFALTDDNHPQSIKYFNLDTNLPLTLGLLVDTSMSQRNVLGDERTASDHFLDQMLTNEKDKAFLIQFDREVDLLADPTSKKETLRHAIDQLGAPQFQNASNNGSGSDGDYGQGGQHHRAGGTLLYDSIYLASDELMSKEKGRKALIILTDGVDRGSKETLNMAIESAQRADTTVYAIYFKGEEQHDNNGGGFPGGRRGGMGGGWPGGGGGYPGGGGGYPRGGGGQRPSEGSKVDGKKVLEQICGETGGRMFEVSKKENPDQIYTTIAEELRSQYILGYTPDKSVADSGGYHRIALTANKKDLIVQTRQGYYSGSN